MENEIIVGIVTVVLSIINGLTYMKRGEIDTLMGIANLVAVFTVMS